MNVGREAKVSWWAGDAPGGSRTGRRTGRDAGRRARGQVRRSRNGGRTAAIPVNCNRRYRHSNGTIGAIAFGTVGAAAHVHRSTRPDSRAARHGHAHARRPACPVGATAHRRARVPARHVDAVDPQARARQERVALHRRRGVRAPRRTGLSRLAARLRLLRARAHGRRPAAGRQRRPCGRGRARAQHDRRRLAAAQHAAHRQPGEGPGPRLPAGPLARRRAVARAARAVGRATGRYRARACRGQRRRRAPSRRALGEGVPGRLLHRAATLRPAGRRGLHPAGRDARRGAEAAGRRDAPDAVHDRRRFHRARGARVYLGRRHPREPAAPEAFHDRPVFPYAGRHGRAVRRPAVGDREHGRNREALQPQARARQAEAAAVPDAGRHVARRLPGPAVEGRARDPSRAAVSGRSRAQRAARHVLQAARIRVRDHHEDGLSGLLPDRRGLHQLGEEQRRAGRPGPRLGRRFAGRVRARHYRPRPAALQPAVRAFPEPGTRVDARLRHRLLPARPRPRDPVREGEVRRGRRVADRHVRHDGREGGRARHRPRARPRLHVHRWHREADPVQAGQARDDRRRDEGRAAAAGALRPRGRSAPAARSRAARRGPHA